MRQQLLLWVPFRRYRQRWGLYLATPARVAAEGRMLGLHRCESCGQAECDAFYGVTSFDSRRVLVDVTEPEAKIADPLMEDKILATLFAALGDDVLLGLRTEVNQELNRHRRGLKAEHLAMLEKKMMSKKLLERFGVPRLSLFYMPLN